MSIPFVVFGDLPGQPTGLSRIAGDLARHLVADQDALGLDVRSVGWAPWRDLPRHGVGTTTLQADGRQWPAWAYGDFSTRGRYALQTAWRRWWGRQPGIVLAVWDPARCVELAALDLPIARWGYFPIDGENVWGGFGGPAAEAVRGFDRVLAYTAYGERVLGRVLEAPPEIAQRLTGYLPHGIDTTVFGPSMTAAMRDRVVRLAGDPSPETLLVGCVAANQRRKDLGTFAEVLAEVQRVEDHPVMGWLHTTQLVTEAWSIPQLIEDFGLEGRLVVTHDLTDAELAGLYAACIVTIAPGRGEGFGYPIVESLACGTPVVHVDYAGGAEWTPRAGRVPPCGFIYEGPYALKRPVLNAPEFARRVRTYASLRLGAPLPVEMTVAALDWATLWPRWRAWVEAGLEEYHGRPSLGSTAPAGTAVDPPESARTADPTPAAAIDAPGDA